MKAVAIALGVWSVFASVAVAGPLTPPAGPVAPTGKTLAQVEPRIPIQSLSGDAATAYVITQRGSYYLTGNIDLYDGRAGIRIESDAVTIDLNGFTIRGWGGADTNDGIRVVAWSNGVRRQGITIRNGTISGFGGDGVDAEGGDNVLIESLRVIGNNGGGVKVGSRSTVTRCTISDNRSDAIVGGDVLTVTDCTISDNLGDGVRAGGAARIVGCTIHDCYSTGVQVGDRSTVEHCLITHSSDEGIVAGHYSNIRDNSVQYARLEGIKITGNQGRVDSNHVTDCWINIRVTGTGNAVFRNTSGSQRGMVVAEGNQCIISHGIGAATHPLANVSY